MSTLHQLLAEEGFKHKKFLNSQKHVKFRDKVAKDQNNTTLPIYMCNDQKSVGLSKQRSSKASSRRESLDSFSRKQSLDLKRSNTSGKLFSKGDHEPAIDDVAIKAVVSLLSGYIGRYIKDVSFREMIREKCSSCLRRGGKGDSGNVVFTNIELGMESVDNLISDDSKKEITRNELRVKSLKNSIELLSIVASLNSKSSRNNSTCGVPNSHLSACAQFYLSIIYKLEKNDRICARHLLHVFCDSPFLARTHLVPDLWERFFLPHLLHLKVWYHKELEFLSSSQFYDVEKRMKTLTKAYNDQMDFGTIQFALYYKAWLKTGAEAPSLPLVPLPSIQSYASSRRRSSSDSHRSNSSINKSLYHAVFGPKFDIQSADNTSLTGTLSVEGEKTCLNDDGHSIYSSSSLRSHQRALSRSTKSLWHEEAHGEGYPELFSCQSKLLSRYVVNGNHIVRSKSINRKEVVCTNNHSDNLRTAVATVCYSNSLTDSEEAIQVITKSWLDSNNNSLALVALSKPPVIEGLLKVMFGSSDDVILELVVSLLAELVARNNANRLIILDADPQLEIFIKLLRSTSLFLKAAVLLYLLEPKAKQMISIEWIPLVLRVLEFGDQLQTLFTVRCMPRRAAMYFLNQLLTGFDEDKNLENASQVVSVGGLSLLIKSFEMGDVGLRNHAAVFLFCCIKADGSSRNYLAENLNKAALLEHIVAGIQNKSSSFSFSLLTELLCLSRRTRIIRLLAELSSGWGGLSAKHIFLVHLLRASAKERPLVAAILLQLDLLGDPMKHSVYREEAVGALIQSLDSQACNSKVQEQTARALLMIGGSFSYRGDSAVEEWLLRQASFHDKEIVDADLHEEQGAMQDWQRKVAIALLNSGGKRLLAAISNSIANGIPSLAQACLFTVAWMNRILLSVGDDRNFQSATHSNYDRALAERGPPPPPIHHHIKSSECVSMLSILDKELIDPLRDPL